MSCFGYRSAAWLAASVGHHHHRHRDAVLCLGLWCAHLADTNLWQWQLKLTKTQLTILYKHDAAETRTSCNWIEIKHKDIYLHVFYLNIFSLSFIMRFAFSPARCALPMCRQFNWFMLLFFSGKFTTIDFESHMTKGGQKKKRKRKREEKRKKETSRIAA